MKKLIDRLRRLPPPPAVLSLLVLAVAGCAGLELKEIDCRALPPGESCHAGATCKPNPLFVSLWTCQSDAPPVTVPPASPEPPASPSPTPPIVSPSMPPTPPDPSPSPSPTPTPKPSPTPCTTVTTQPSHGRVDRPNGPWLAHVPVQIVKDKSAGKSYERLYRLIDGPQPGEKIKDDCSTPSEKIQWARKTTNWACPDSYPGNPGSCTVDGNPAPCPTYDPGYGNGFCYSTGEGRQRTDRLSNHVDQAGRVLHEADLDGYTGITCPVALAPVVTSVCATPSSPAPPASPRPPGTPPPSNDATLSRIGLGDKIQNIVKGRNGTRYIINSTPKSVRPWCEYTTEKRLWEAYQAGDTKALDPAEAARIAAKVQRGEALADGVDAQRVECEQHPSRQDPRGPKGYQTHLGGAFTNHDLEQSSGNSYLFQIKISDPAEAGDYLIRVCPYDDPITSPRCSERVYRGIVP